MGWILVLLPILAVIGKPTAKQSTAAGPHYISGPINEFSMELYNALAEDMNENLALSPLSAYTLLGMIAAGSNGTTHNQIMSALHLEKLNSTSYFEGMTNLPSSFNISGVADLVLANNIFINKNAKVKKQFQGMLKTFYNTDIKSIDFSKNQEASLTINNWVEQQTYNKITNIVQPNEIDDQTELVLVNTMYFKGIWKNKFEAGSLRFQIQNGSKRVPAITGNGKFGYKKLQKMSASAIEIPYKSDIGSNEISMIIVLPDFGASLNDIEKKLQKLGLPIFEDRNKITTKLLLPKFEVSSTIDLPSSLKKLNITDMFDKPDFSVMTNSKLQVSKMIQKVMITVTEEGSEAAAASESIMILRSISPSPRIITVDRPFLVFICNQDFILFTGRIVDPLELTKT